MIILPHTCTQGHEDEGDEKIREAEREGESYYTIVVVVPRWSLSVLSFILFSLCLTFCGAAGVKKKKERRGVWGEQKDVYTR